MDTTERVIELEVVINVLLPRQRNTDKEPTMDDPEESKASPRQTINNEEETPFFTTYAHLVLTAKSPAPESEEYELSSSDEVVNKEFEKRNSYLDSKKP